MKKYLPYNILDLTEYGEIFDISTQEFGELVQRAIREPSPRFTISNDTVTDISDGIIKSNVPLNILCNIPNNIQRIRAQFMNHIGYMNVDMINNNATMISQFWFQSDYCLSAQLYINDNEASLDVMLIANRNT